MQQRKEASAALETVNKICVALLIVGGLNWGLIGLFNFDAVGWLFGGTTALISRIIFAIVGIAAICAIPGLFSSNPRREST